MYIYITFFFNLFFSRNIDNGGYSLRCCSVDNKIMLSEKLSYFGCYPIEVPKDDPFYSQFNMTCIDYIRSQPVFPNDCSIGPAEIVGPFFMKHI